MCRRKPGKQEGVVGRGTAVGVTVAACGEDLHANALTGHSGCNLWIAVLIGI